MLLSFSSDAFGKHYLSFHVNKDKLKVLIKCKEPSLHSKLHDGSL